MPSFPCVHHVEVGVTDGPRAVHILRTNYTFDVLAIRNSKVARQWLLVKNDTRYVVTCLKTTRAEEIDVSSLQDSISDMAIWKTFDHIAYAVEVGQSNEVIAWYENCFGMRKFQIQSEGSTGDELVLSTDYVKRRFRVMEYWKCAETGLTGSKEDAQGSRLTIVLQESLAPIPEGCKIESWMRHHGGPGIHHVAMSTDDIKASVSRLESLGAVFANPPPKAYYTEVGRLYDIQKAGEDLEALRQNGILIDTEDGEVRGMEGSNRVRYMLNRFTKAIFPKSPFFMEIIQREGASGFGFGNVAAFDRCLKATKDRNC